MVFQDQVRCVHCIHFRIDEETCNSTDYNGRDRCCFERAVYNRTRVRNRRCGSDAFRDLLGNHVDDCGDKKLLKQRKQ